MNYKSIALDGPSGSGKSTIARLLANELGYTYVDTGAMYRAITLKALQLNIDLADESQYGFIKDTLLEPKGTMFFMDGVDVTDAIRTEPIVKNVSLVSSLGYVRKELVEQQRAIARRDNVVMDGRDIGTNVLPNATLKIFMIADVEVRAKRRYLEQKLKGSTMSVDEVLADLKRRDTFDSTRALNPLKQAEDAIVVDSTTLTIYETFTKILNIYKELKHE